jgi:hypothetical protein
VREKGPALAFQLPLEWSPLSFKEEASASAIQHAKRMVLLVFQAFGVKPRIHAAVSKGIISLC